MAAKAAFDLQVFHRSDALTAIEAAIKETNKSKVTWSGKAGSKQESETGAAKRHP
jgi:hypothetical protein